MPTEPVSYRVRQAIEAALARVQGGSSYHYDLDAPTIRRGLYPPTSPPMDGTCVALSRRVAPTTWGEGTLTGVTRRISFLIQGWAMASTDSLDDRLLAAERLEGDLLNGLRAEVLDATSLLHSAHGIQVDSEAASGHEAGLSRSCGYVELLITVSAHLERDEVS